MYQYKVEIISTDCDHFGIIDLKNYNSRGKRNSLYMRKVQHGFSEKTIYNGTVLAGNLKVNY